MFVFPVRETAVISINSYLKQKRALRSGCGTAVFLAVLFMLPLFGGWSAAAEESAVTGLIEVKAASPSLLPAPSAGRTRLDAAQIEASGADSLVEVLGTISGLAVQPYGASGTQAAVSIRGSTTNQVLVLVDGIPVSDPSSGLSDFSRLAVSIDDIESVEVIRGGASAQYGADAVGGVVLISTKNGGSSHESGWGLRLRAGTVSRIPFSATSGSGFSAQEISPSALSLVDGQKLSFRADIPGGFCLSGEAEREANQYRYRDSNEVDRVRSNADIMRASLAAGWAGSFAGGQLRLDAAGGLRELGVPGAITALTPNARQNDLNARADASYSNDSLFDGRAAISVSAFGLLANTLYRETASSNGDTNNATRAGISTRSTVLIGENSSVGFGLSGRCERLDSSNVTTSSGGVPERYSGGAYVEPELNFGSWMIAPAFRFDCTSDYPSGCSYSLGAVKGLSEKLKLSMNVSRSYRAPSFDDLYWPSAGGVAGNPDLLPETSYSADVGLKYGTEELSLAASLYARYVKDVILWQEGDDGIWRPSNWGEALYPGLEVEASGSSGPYWARISYTYLHSYVLSGGLELSDDKRVPMVPEHEFALSAGYSLKNIRISLSLQYEGLRYIKMANVAYEPSHFVLNWHLRAVLSTSAALTFDADNFFNERYEMVVGYPMPGFSLASGIELNL